MPKSTKVASKPLDVLLVSDIRADLVLTGNTRPKFQQIAQIVSGYSLELGGSASIFASQLAKLGAQVGVLGYVGADTVGDLALQELDQIGVDITRIKRHPSVKTGVGIHFAERNDRAILTYLDRRIWGVSTRPAPKTLMTHCSTAAVTGTSPTSHFLASLVEEVPEGRGYNVSRDNWRSAQALGWSDGVIALHRCVSVQ